MDDLDRMFRRLVQNIRNGYPEYLAHPFEVSELYQHLIPYRHNRRELAIDTNQDYEVALCRLLSGERLARSRRAAAVRGARGRSGRPDSTGRHRDRHGRCRAAHHGWLGDAVA